ncbi:DUF4829 domain-containing protein [Congzhengia minquanensis]|uniref:DUF4829 domain-containing protein n=1 Tax=Congzhengia minquanensis TaxID=2763657 RepID=A0A926HYZ6_9FIRM|nr:DUF4829 domain-containing protein [Congzhengia minquanensis]MBC8541624.1 DUF4829 domain-containing protein [Congzhengia minquanensis]
MKFRVLIIISVLVLLIILCYTLYIPTRPHGMSPEETVNYYFEQYNDKNIKKINSITHPSHRSNGAELDFNKLISVKVINLQEEKDSNKIFFDYKEVYSSPPYQVSMVRAKYDIQFKGEFGSTTRSGINETNFYLIKKHEDSDWLIVSMGLG